MITLAVSATNGQVMNVTEDLPAFNAARTLSIGYIVFPGWQPLDVFGPMELLFSLSLTSKAKMTLSVISKTTGPISSRVPKFRGAAPGEIKDLHHLIGPSIEATHTYLNAPAIDVLFVPGGLGTIPLDQTNDTWVEDFINSRIDRLDYIASVCTGAQFLAKSGILKGKKATTNKASWERIVVHGEDIEWVPTARWVEDGKVWTSSGVSAGMDMTYALLKRWYGSEKANKMVNLIEYVPHTDPSWDPFSVVHNVPGADKNRSLEDCGVPVGYES
ncbi:hypothetical protein GX51_01365 [Blastomyces parvus]|uniref:DJ-1/PfpI domain-containing protein n=1 Tax=Blastomyces parvus TaxID=2060905 RepID=A0A2B7XHF8_9EURO|nr:hypothetical protein GX51_01365 [Blastomyces parvus]